MKKPLVNYETLLTITRAMSMSKDPDKIVRLTVRSIRETLGIKGCALFLFDSGSDQLQVAASEGLSENYINKGPVSALKSIARSLKDGPVAIYDVTDDPRIQYPEAAQAEGIASILSVPIFVGGETIGCMRVYTAKPEAFTMEDVNFVQALAEIAGILIDVCRLYKGQQEYINVLSTMQEARDM